MTRQKVLVTKKADPESGPKSRGQTVGQYLVTMCVRLDTFEALRSAERVPSRVNKVLFPSGPP
jgi:hypothetical protein